MRLKNLLTVATLCTLALATSVSADDGEGCVHLGNNAGFNVGFGQGGWNGWNGWNGGGAIQVMNAFYGANCGAQYNVGWSVQSICNGHQGCSYHVDANMIGDPAFGCRKDFRVDYSCGDGQMRQAYLMGEASGQTLALSCN